MRVFVAGSTGVLGRRLVPRLVRAGHEVIALVRSFERAAAFAELPAVTLVLADVMAQAELVAREMARREPEVVVNQLTAIPDRIDPRRVGAQLALTSALRSRGTWNLLVAARAAGVRRLISQSVAFAYDPGGGDAVHVEDDPLLLDGAHASFHGVHDAIRSLEIQTLGVDRNPRDRAVEGVVLRYGAFYGPGTIYAPGGSFAEDVRRRRIPIVGGGGGVFSFIHLDDAADATVAALDGPEGVYNIVDDTPVPARDWIPSYARMLGARPLRRIPGWLGRLGGGAYAAYLMMEQRGASNARAKRELGWRPAHAEWEAGFAAMNAAAAEVD